MHVSTEEALRHYGSVQELPEMTTTSTVAFYRHLPDGSIQQCSYVFGDVMVIAQGESLQIIDEEFASGMAALYGRRLTGERLGPAFRLAPGYSPKLEHESGS